MDKILARNNELLVFTLNKIIKHEPLNSKSCFTFTIKGLVLVLRYYSSLAFLFNVFCTVLYHVSFYCCFTMNKI